MQKQITSELRMVGACINVATSKENAAVWTGKPPLAFGVEFTKLQTDYNAVVQKAATADSAKGGSGDAKALAEITLEGAAFVMARALSLHFRKTANLDNLGKVNVSKSDIVRLRTQDLLDKAMAIRDVGLATKDEPGAGERGITDTNLATLTTAITAFAAVMNNPRSQIVSRSTLLKEVATDVASLMQQIHDLDDLILQFNTTPAGTHFVEEWKKARAIVDMAAHPNTMSTPTPVPAPAATK